MWSMFFNNSAFNIDINSWDVSSVESMEGCFTFATSFNSDLSSWDTSSVKTFLGMFYGAEGETSTMSCPLTKSQYLHIEH